MAAAKMTLTLVKKRQIQGMFVVTFTVTPTDDYVTGGTAFTPTLESLHPLGKSPDIVEVYGSAGFIFQYDHANSKLLTYTNSAGGTNNALAQHSQATFVANIVSVAHKGFAIWLV